MTPKVKISEFVLKRLDSLQISTDLPKYGGLYGLMYNNTLIVLGFNLASVKQDLLNIQHNFPTEIDFCGMIDFDMRHGDDDDDESYLTDIFHSVDITDNPILIKCKPGNSSLLRASVYKHGNLEDIKFDVMPEEDLYNEFFFARLQCFLELNCDKSEKSISDNMFRLRKKLASGNISFMINNTRIFLSGGSSGSTVIGLNEEKSMCDLLATSSSSDESITNAKSKKKSVKKQEFDIMEMGMFLQKSKQKTDENLNNNTLRTIYKNDNIFKIPLAVDALSMLHRDTKLTLLYDILVESICRYLRLVEQNLLDELQYIEQNEINRDLGVPESFQFMPAMGHFLTLVYPVGLPDEDQYLLSKRVEMAKSFGLTEKRPYFRKAAVCKFRKDIGSKILINPHVGLKSQVDGGTQYLVYGKYTYHHYMQDNFDDNGWGCAYRSLQTLCSWFRFQGYSEASIPSHKEIQQLLHSLGDKPESFVNSKQWIGSTEVSMCLQTNFKIDSKIMHVGSGSDLSTLGPELSYHFKQHGTPIMIGGGQLAHTILGIDYNSSTGDIRYLILDPHYTGVDDLTIVQSKGWCGWKNNNFWDKNSFYNLCLPQRPLIV